MPRKPKHPEILTPRDVFGPDGALTEDAARQVITRIETLRIAKGATQSTMAAALSARCAPYLSLTDRQYRRWVRGDTPQKLRDPALLHWVAWRMAIPFSYLTQAPPGDLAAWLGDDA